MDNGEAPATKHDVQMLRSELKEDGQTLRSELKHDVQILRSELNHVYDNLVERIADSETRLLQAFYAYAESNNKRMIQNEGNTAAFLNRIGALENRVLDIEKRLNMPPPQ